MIKNKEDILNQMKIFDPLLLVDEISFCNNMIIGKAYLRDDFFFKRHIIGGEPIFPGTLQLEAMTQTIAYSIMKKNALKTVPTLVGITNVRFFQKIKFGDNLEISVQLGEERRGIIKASAECRNQDILCSSANFIYKIKI